MKTYLIESLPIGIKVEDCTVARANTRNSQVFVKTKEGKIFFVSRGYAQLDLADSYGPNEKDRSTYARLAGISVKEINDARKKRREEEIFAENKRDLYTAKRIAEKLGMKLVKK